MRDRKKDKVPAWVYVKIGEFLDKILEKEGRDAPS